MNLNELSLRSCMMSFFFQMGSSVPCRTERGKNMLSHIKPNLSTFTLFRCISASEIGPPKPLPSALDGQVSEGSTSGVMSITCRSQRLIHRLAYRFDRRMPWGPTDSKSEIQWSLIVALPISWKKGISPASRLHSMHLFS